MKSPCYCAVLRAAARKATALYDEELAPVGLNLAQYSLLRIIERAGTVSLTELGQVAELDRSTIGRNARVLQRQGVVRLTAAHDHRETAVALAPAGVDALRRGGPLWEAAQRHIEDRLGVEGARQLRAVAQRL
jgi:DNA-binding MarR family transcriptional regulator